MSWFAVISIQSDISLPEPVPDGATPRCANVSLRYHSHCTGVDIGPDKYLATSDGFLEPGRKFFKTIKGFVYSATKILNNHLSIFIGVN